MNPVLDFFAWFFLIVLGGFVIFAALLILAVNDKFESLALPSCVVLFVLLAWSIWWLFL